MGNFIGKLVSDSNEVSSKRVIAIIGTVLLVIVVIAILYGIAVQNELLYSLIALISGNSAMTLKNSGNRGTYDESNNYNGGNSGKNV